MTLADDSPWRAKPSGVQLSQFTYVQDKESSTYVASVLGPPAVSNDESDQRTRAVAELLALAPAMADRLLNDLDEPLWPDERTELEQLLARVFPARRSAPK